MAGFYRKQWQYTIGHSSLNLGNLFSLLLLFLLFFRVSLGDLEKEKRRLQNILALGQEEPTAASSQNVPASQNPGVAEERDQYQEGEADGTETDDVQE